METSAAVSPRAPCLYCGHAWYSKSVDHCSLTAVCERADGFALAAEQELQSQHQKLCSLLLKRHSQTMRDQSNQQTNLRNLGKVQNLGPIHAVDTRSHGLQAAGCTVSGRQCRINVTSLGSTRWAALQAPLLRHVFYMVSHFFVCVLVHPYLIQGLIASMAG